LKMPSPPKINIPVSLSVSAHRGSESLQSTDLWVNERFA
jgi:hypothetical protein